MLLKFDVNVLYRRDSYRFLIDSRAEDACADSYHRASALLGDKVVAAHSVRAFCEIRVISEVFSLDFIEECRGFKEFGPYLLLVIHIACHHHDAADAYVVKVFPFAFSEQFAPLFRRHSAFGFLFGDVKFEKDIDGPAYFLSLLVYFLEQAQRVYGFDH